MGLSIGRHPRRNRPELSKSDGPLGERYRESPESTTCLDEAGLKINRAFVRRHRFGLLRLRFEEPPELIVRGRVARVELEHAIERGLRLGITRCRLLQHRAEQQVSFEQIRVQRYSLP